MCSSLYHHMIYARCQEKRNTYGKTDDRPSFSGRAQRSGAVGQFPSTASFRWRRSEQRPDNTGRLGSRRPEPRATTETGANPGKTHLIACAAPVNAEPAVPATAGSWLDRGRAGWKPSSNAPLMCLELLRVGCHPRQRAFRPLRGATRNMEPESPRRACCATDRCKPHNDIRNRHRRAYEDTRPATTERSLRNDHSLHGREK